MKRSQAHVEHERELAVLGPLLPLYHLGRALVREPASIHVHVKWDSATARRHDVFFAIADDNLTPVPVGLVNLQNDPGRAYDKRMGIERAKGVGIDCHPGLRAKGFYSGCLH